MIAPSKPKNQLWSILRNIKFYSNFPTVPKCILYSRRIQFRITYNTLLFCLFWCLRSGTFPQVFFDFYDLHTFEDCMPVILYMFPQYEFIWCFLMITFRLAIFVRKPQKECFVLSIASCQVVHNFSSITNAVHFDYLIKVVPGRFLSCKVTVFSVGSNKYFVGGFFGTM